MSALMPLEVGSDNIEEVKAAISEWEEKCAIDEGAFDQSYHVLLALEGRLDELNWAEGYTGRREQRREYWRAVVG